MQLLTRRQITFEVLKSSNSEFDGLSLTLNCYRSKTNRVEVVLNVLFSSKFQVYHILYNEGAEGYSSDKAADNFVKQSEENPVSLALFENILKENYEGTDIRATIDNQPYLIDSLDISYLPIKGTQAGKLCSAIIVGAPIPVPLKERVRTAVDNCRRGFVLAKEFLRKSIYKYL